MKLPKWALWNSLILSSIIDLIWLIGSFSNLVGQDLNPYFISGYLFVVLFLFFFSGLIPLILIWDKIKSFKKE